jgi:hypothetical protein
MSLVHYADIKALLGLEKTEDQYPALMVLIDSVQASIESYTGRKFEFGTHNERIFIVKPTQFLPLSALPVYSIESIVDASGSVITDYQIAFYGLKSNAWTANGYLDIEYDGGYTIASMPPEIKRAALLQIAFEYQNHDNIGAESVSTQGGVIQRPALSLLDEVKNMLNHYKHPINRIM